ncbi:hypothetical protein E1B28_001615 [Marasmius oreades]|nr:uncharacterized protein E1B28_001615 [Marasmius oreades]KAG7099804.1 hypothetical protein E1B28_001615 [Marasmius oreades]
MIVEAILYGIFTVLTIGTLYILTKRGSNADLNYAVIFTSVLMFVLATAEIVVNCVVIFDAFIEIAPGPNPRAVRKLKMDNLGNPLVLAKKAIFLTMMILGDVIVIYRCWIVWAKNWYVIILSSLCCLASATIAYMTMYSAQHPGTYPGLLERPWASGAAMFTLSIVANGVANLLIAFRIWRNEREVIHHSTGSSRTAGRLPSSVVWGRNSFFPIARIILESGALYTVFLIAFTIVLRRETPRRQQSMPILANMITPLIGIIFSLVIVRVKILSNRSLKDSQRTTAASSQHPIEFNQNRSEQNNDEEMYALEPESNVSLQGKSIAYSSKHVPVQSDQVEGYGRHRATSDIS